MAKGYNLEQETPNSRFYLHLGCRHFQSFMLFCLMTIAYSTRSNLSVTIVAMTSPIGSYTDNVLLPWTPFQQAVILGAFSWGYGWLQVLAGHLSRKYGPKYFFFGAMMVSSITTLLSPLIAYNCSWVVFCVGRVVVGLSQGFFYPCTITRLSKWAPPLEKGRLLSFTFMGTQIGSMVTVFVSGYLAASSWGWPSIFYVTGGCGILWSVVWLFLGANSPDSHPRISTKEKLYIKDSLVGASGNSSKIQTPWKEIVTSLPVWAILITQLGYNWGYWTMASMMPIYFSHVLNLKIESNGIFTAVSHLSKCVFIILMSWIDDFVKRRHLLSLVYSRKIFNSIALWGGAVALVAMPLTTSTPAALVLFILAMAINGAIYSGALGNHTDLSPNFSGLLMGITNGLSALTSILGPTVTGFIVQDQSSRSEWMISFFTSAAFFFFGNLFYVVFGSAEQQTWNEPKSQTGVTVCSRSSVHSGSSSKDSSAHQEDK